MLRPSDYGARMIDLSCHCGQLRIHAATRPDFLHACNCSLCAKSSAHWAYLDPVDVTMAGETRAYRRADKAEPGADIHFCPTCGCVTHFTLAESAVAKFGNVVMGVNMGLAAEADLAGIELRYPDGRAWSGEGPFDYVREARILGG